MSVELFAVNAVSDRIASCPRLVPEISVGDRTPITDGHIDFYKSDGRSNQAHEGRVPVQIKGRVRKTNIEAPLESQSFAIERDVLRFFRNHGGGIYFYVSMLKGGLHREIFYTILLPFKVDRLLNGGAESQRTFSIKLARLPVEASKVEGIVQLAWDGRSQSSFSGGTERLLEEAESLTIHSLAGFDETQPTHLALSDTDFVVLARLPGGAEFAVDIDLEILPSDYLERDLAVSIVCGGVEFSGGSGRRLDPQTFLVHLAAGLNLRLTEVGNEVSTTLNLTRDGSLREQAKNLDFVIAAASGHSVAIGDSSPAHHDEDSRLRAELLEVRTEITRLIELFDELGVDDHVTSTVVIDDEVRRILLSLHEALVHDRPARGKSDGTGRFDIAFGAYKIVVLIMPTEEEGHRRIIDPFDPTKRQRFRLYRVTDEGSPESIDWGTVYEGVTAEDLASVINLRLRELVPAYKVLGDRASAKNNANLMVLRLLSAADLAPQKGHRTYLLQGAIDLSEWLLSENPDSLVHRINWWQAKYRLGELSDLDRREIRAARRQLNKEDQQANLLEACLLILLEDANELDLVISELRHDENTWLKSWPVWSLVHPDSKELQ